MIKINNLQSFIDKANNIHKNKYDYSKSIYIKNKEDIIIICPMHGEWISTPNRHLAGGNCPKCNKQHLLSQNDFIDRCNKAHNFYYDYSATKYISMRFMINIICPIHGKFEQKPQSHINGHGCVNCYYDSLKIIFNDFVKKANYIHNSLYEYLMFDDNNKNIILLCKKHGKFKQNKFNHLNGRGCRKCAVEKDKYNNFIFIEKSNIIHKNIFDYSKVNYITNNIKIIIICKLHGEFEQLPSHHMNGVGCPKCSNMISKLEIKWLDSLNIPNSFRNKIVKINNRSFKPDAIDINKKIIYEFYGDFWHGNPKMYNSNYINSVVKKSFGELYSKTLEKEKFIKQNGYNIISIWENDFNNEQ